MTDTNICTLCGRALPSGHLIPLDDHFLCPDCLDENTVICSHCGDRIWIRDNVGSDDTPLCQTCYDRHFTTCERCGAIIRENEAYYEGEDDDTPYCYDCHQRRRRERPIHDYYFKPEPIFHGDGLRYFGVELEIDGVGECNDAARQILRAADSEDEEYLYIKHDGSLDDGMELVTHPMTLDFHKSQMPWAAVLQKAINMDYIIQQEPPSMQVAPASTAVIALVNRIAQDSQILQNSNPISAPSMGSPSLYRQDAYYHPARQKASFVAPVLPTAHKPNAYALAQKFANNVNFFTHDHCLYVFNGRYFELTPQKTAESLILDICRVEIAASGTPQISSNVYKFLTTDPVFQQGDDVFTQRFVAFKNGTLDIRTRCFSPNDPQFLTIYGLTCNYYSAPPPCPAFDSFLYQCSGGDPLWIERAWQFIGYALVPDTGGKAALLLQGIGDSGKSKFCEFLQTFFAPQHVSALSISELNQQFAASELEGKLLCVSPDLPKGPLKPAAVSNIKRLSGNDLVSAPKKYEANRQFKFLGTFVIATNHSIYTAGEDDALMKRLITLPFRYTVPKEQQDPFLLEKLLPERDAVARKAIEAYFRLVANHYRFAGEYLPNECVPFDGMSSNRIPPGAVEEFLLRDFTPCEDGLVFVNDVHTEFKQWYPNAPINSFSREFGQLAAAHFGSTRIRTHKPGEPYASAAITGINYMKRRF